MSEPKTLLLRETGIVRLADGTEAVNVGPIVQALSYLTEGRGDDRGTDEHGTPLPDLLSLAFEVVQSIILGGRSAEYFRRVKQELDAQSGLDGRSSLALAKQAATVRPRAPSTMLERAASELRARLAQLDQLPLAEEERSDLTQALRGFGDFGADRWVAATSHLLLALRALDTAKPALPARRRSPRSQSAAVTKRRVKAKPVREPAARAKAKPPKEEPTAKRPVKGARKKRAR